MPAWDMEWHMERTEERSHGGATGFEPPSGVKFQRIPPPENIGTMLHEGKIDASLLYLTDANLVDRSRIDFNNHPHVRRLFPDPIAEGARYYKKTGFYPINHCVVLQKKVVEQHPWAVLNVFKAFNQAKDMVHARTKELATVLFELGLVPNDQRKVLDIDPYVYGVKSNHTILEAMMGFSHEQGLTPRQFKLEEVFAPQTLDL